MPRDTQNPATRRDRRPAAAPTPTGAAAATARRRCSRTTTRLIDVLPHLHQHALDVDGRRLLAALRAQSAQRRPAGDVGLRPRRAADRSVAAGPDGGARSSPRRSTRHAPTLVDRRRRGRCPISPSRLGTPRGAAACRSSAARERVGLLAIGFDAPPRTAGADVARRESADAFVAALELFRLRQDEELQRDVRALLDEFSRQPVGDAEPGGRPRHLLPRREPAVRRRSHVGLDPRPARAAPRAAGLVRSRRTSRAARGRAPTTLSAPAAVAMRQRARRDRLASADDSRHGHGDRAAARLPPRARHDRVRRRARRAGRRARPARPRRRARAASSRAPSRTCSCSTM